eukprot:151479-Chlamydomonas_euryale.AAC.1
MMPAALRRLSCPPSTRAGRVARVWHDPRVVDRVPCQEGQPGQPGGEARRPGAQLFKRGAKCRVGGCARCCSCRPWPWSWAHRYALRQEGAQNFAKRTGSALLVHFLAERGGRSQPDASRSRSAQVP